MNLVSIPPIQQLSHARRSTEDEETNTLSLTQQTYFSSESEVTSSCISSLPEPNSNSSGCEIENQRITSSNYFVPLTTVCVPPSEPESGENIFYGQLRRRMNSLVPLMSLSRTAFFDK